MDYDADAAKAARIGGLAPVAFTLGGQRFRCRRAISAAEMFDAIDAEREAETGRGKHEVRCAFVATCLDGDAARTRWAKVLADPKAAIDEEDVSGIVIALVGAYGARPTSPSNGSSAGRRSNGTASKSTRTGRSRAKPKGS